VCVPNPIAGRLAERGYLILDGALATELERRGADLNDALWSAKVLLEQPDLIRRVHADYFQAGADVAITASYQASYAGLAQRGISREQATELLQQTVALAAAARREFLAAQPDAVAPPMIAASVGPYGAALADGSEYRGHYGIDDDALAAFHRPRLAALLAATPDLLACETLPSLREARVLVKLLSEHPDACAWISFACRNGTHTCEGQDVAECARVLDGVAQVVAIGVNCTAPEHVASLLQRMRLNTSKPLLAYPNSGEHYDANSKRWHGRGAGGLASLAPSWYDAGARLIGGCCRTTPEDIRSIRASLASCA
jgi:homocysteine S-methyltransferase